MTRTSTRSRWRSPTAGCRRPWIPRRSRLLARPSNPTGFTRITSRNPAAQLAPEPAAPAAGFPASIHWYHWMQPESTDAVPPPAPLPIAALAEPLPSVETLYRGLEAHLRETRPKAVSYTHLRAHETGR